MSSPSLFFLCFPSIPLTRPCSTYQNSASVTDEVNRIKDSPALLLWYTGDEPDGTSDPFSSTSNAYSLINSLDGYHPISLVLNCENYHWSDYSAGGDIIMQDTYPIGINATWSVRWVCLLLFRYRMNVYANNTTAEHARDARLR